MIEDIDITPSQTQEICAKNYIAAGYEYLFSLPDPLLQAIVHAEIKNYSDFAGGRISKYQYYHWKSLSWFTKEALIGREIGWPNA